MKRSVLFAIATAAFALTALSFSSSATLALGHVGLGSHSETDIKNHCGAAGGTYYNSSGAYGCFGPGGDVTCSSKTKKCFGTCTNCAAAIKPGGRGSLRGVQGILTVAPAGSQMKTFGKNLNSQRDLTLTAKPLNGSNRLSNSNSNLINQGSLGSGPKLMKQDIGATTKH